jgi:Fic family protein
MIPKRKYRTATDLAAQVSTPTAEPRPVGHVAIRELLGLRVPPPAVASYVGPGARRTEIHEGRIFEFYPKQYMPDGSLVSQLRFALRHEPVDLGVLVAAFKAMDPGEIADWVREEPTGAYSRRAWFLYETFTGRELDLPPATANYVEALDPTRHLVAARRNSPRHRVADNLLGGRDLCLTVRRTTRLGAAIAAHHDARARALTERYDPHVLARAVSYLYTKETRSSFAIEGETPSSQRAERFVHALQGAARFDPTSKDEIVRLQGAIVEPRYAATDWRDFQNFVGETIGGYRQRVHFICPRPQDVPGLMAGWMASAARLDAGPVDPVVSAAVLAFGFVFIHPFEDGNGRIHRFLVHHVLAKRGFSPPGLIFPVSAAILRDRRGYDEVLESFSKPLFDYIDWRWTPDIEIDVLHDTGDLYRYFDATAFAEYLYDRVADTVERDLREELDYISVYDHALAAVTSIIDMPDRRASLFVRLCLQNNGRLSKAKRDTFAELTDAEIAQLETAIQRAIQEEPGPAGGERIDADASTLLPQPGARQALSQE